jgi:hypothetical protein
MNLSIIQRPTIWGFSLRSGFFALYDNDWKSFIRVVSELSNGRQGPRSESWEPNCCTQQQHPTCRSSAGLQNFVGHLYLNAPEHYHGLLGSVDWYRDVML